MNFKKIIREEIDDLDWIRDVRSNPWGVYTYILMDVEPSKDNLKWLVDQAIESGKLSEVCINAWEGSYENEILTIIYYFKRDGRAYLRIEIPRGWVYFGSVAQPNPDDVVIKYSELFNK